MRLVADRQAWKVFGMLFTIISVQISLMFIATYHRIDLLEEKLISECHLEGKE